MVRAAVGLIAVAILAAGCASGRQLRRWHQAAGPPGARIDSLTFVAGRPGLVYTVAGPHVFASRDGGATWAMDVRGKKLYAETDLGVAAAE